MLHDALLVAPTDVPGDFLCLRIDTRMLKSEVKYEAGEGFACGERISMSAPRLNGGRASRYENHAGPLFMVRISPLSTA